MINHRVGLFLICITCLLSISGHALANKSLTFTVAEHFPPYHGTALKNGGPVVEITKEAFKLVGYDVDVNFYPWARAYKLATNGTVTGILALWYRKDRESQLEFTNSIGEDSTCFLTKKSTSFKYSKLSDIKGKRVGISRDYSYPKEFNDLKDIKKLAGVNEKEIIRLVNKDIVDVSLVARNVAKFVMTKELKLNLDKYVFLKPCLTREYFFNGISKKHKNYKKITKDFNKGLALLKSSGTLKKILKKHGNIVTESEYNVKP